MTTADTTRIQRSVEIAAPPERVWRALVTAEEIGAWFQMIVEGDLAPGAEIWMTTTHPQMPGVRFPVYITEMTAPHRLVWEWHPGQVDADFDWAREPRTIVTFTLEPSARGTRVTVEESGFEKVPAERRAKALADNTQGWTEVVVWLQRYVEQAH